MSKKTLASRRYTRSSPSPLLSCGDAVPADVPGVPDAALPPSRDAIRRDHGEAALGDGDGEGRGGRPANKPKSREKKALVAARVPPLAPAVPGALLPEPPHISRPPPVELGVDGVADPKKWPARDRDPTELLTEPMDCGVGGCISGAAARRRGRASRSALASFLR